MLNAYNTSGSSPTEEPVSSSQNQPSDCLAIQGQSCREACALACVVFQGVQEGFGEFESLCLFATSPYSTTFCLPVSQVTAKAILTKLILAEGKIQAILLAKSQAMGVG